MPAVAGDWIGAAVVRAKHDEEWWDMARWDGHVCRVVLAPGRAEVPVMTYIAPILGLAMLGMVMAPAAREIGRTK
jgi:hypothetical protein